LSRPAMKSFSIRSGSLYGAGPRVALHLIGQLIKFPNRPKEEVSKFGNFVFSLIKGVGTLFQDCFLRRCERIHSRIGLKGGEENILQP
jgi:hypothetical protein